MTNVHFKRYLLQIIQQTTFLSLHVMLLLENVYVVLEAAEGRLFLCKSFGQTVHGLMCGGGGRGWAGTRVGDWARAMVRVVGGEWRDVFRPKVVCDAV